MFKLLIIILTIFSATFAMEEQDWSKNALDIKEAFNKAKVFELASPEKAMEEYAKVIGIQLPAADPTNLLVDLYSTERGYQNIAASKIQYLTQKILDSVQELVQKNQYDGALTLLNTIPENVRKKNVQISKLESDIKAKKQQATDATIAALKLGVLAATATQVFQNAEELAKDGNYNKAYEILAPLKTQTFSQDISKKATELEVKIKEQEAQSLINKEKYDEASTILNTLPASKQEVIDLKAQIDNEKETKRARELANSGNYQEAYKILNSLKEKGFLKANTLDRALIEEQLKEAKGLANTGDYAKAYAVLDILKANRPGEEVETEKEIKARQKTQQEAELQKQADETQRKAQEAEKERLAQEELQKKQAAERQEQEQLTKAQQFISAENYEEARKILSTLNLNQPLSSPEASQRRDALRELIRAYQYAYGLDKNYTAAYSILDSLKKKKLSPEIGDEITKLETKINTKQQQEQTIPDKPLTKDLNNAFNHLANTLTLITKYIVESPTGSKTTHLLEAPTRFRPRPPGRAASTKPLSQQK